MQLIVCVCFFLSFQVVIAHYQEPAEELAGTLRAALDLDYPPDRLIIR